MRRLLSAARHRRHREAKVHRPGPTTRALPSMVGRGERSESPALGSGNTRLAAGSTVPTAKNRRTGAPEGAASPIARGRAVSPARERGSLGAVSALHPLTLFGEGAKGIKAHPAALQIIRAAELWLFDRRIELLSKCVPRAAVLPSPLVGEGGVRISGRRVRGKTTNSFREEAPHPPSLTRGHLLPQGEKEEAPPLPRQAASAI
jgi:hypothetical protein